MQLSYSLQHRRVGLWHRYGELTLCWGPLSTTVGCERELFAQTQQSRLTRTMKTRREGS